MKDKIFILIFENNNVYRHNYHEIRYNWVSYLHLQIFIIKYIKQSPDIQYVFDGQARLLTHIEVLYYILFVKQKYDSSPEVSNQQK